MCKIFKILLGGLIFLSGQLVAQEIDRPLGNYEFIPNGGQWPDHIHYRATSQAGNIWLEKEGILYDFKSFETKDKKVEGAPHFHPDQYKRRLVYARFLNANTDFKTVQEHPSRQYFGFFLGNDESKWASGLHAYNHITYQNLYEGIDLTFYEKEGNLKYEYLVHPGANPSQILVKYYGYDKIRKLKNGNVQIETELGQVLEQKPYVYQIKNGRIVEIESQFVLNKKDELSIELGEYDEELELVIDPVLVFATYCGSFTDNFGMTATYAYTGEAYSAGMIYGNAYPTPGPAWNTISNFTVANIPSPVTTDAFVSKYSADGTTMIWTNFVGGGNNSVGTETVHSLICDTDDNIYMYGVTSSLDFPLMNEYQSTHAGGTSLSVQYNGTNFGSTGTDIYITKISADGMSLMGSTYIGGSGNDGVNYKVTSGTYNNVAAYDSLTFNYGDQFRGEIMLDSMNNIYITSSTRSADFPYVNGFQSTIGGQQDGVVFKLSEDFSTLLWSSYYGGSQNDAAYSIKLDSSYNVIIAGGTSSTDLPGVTGGLYSTYQGGKTDGFVVKMTNDGTTLTQATYLGTSVYDQAIFVEVDRWDNVYIVGQSLGNMPVINATYVDANSGQFIMKLEPDLATIDYSTEFGSGTGSIDISPSAFLVDVCGNVYVSGWGGNILPGGPPISPMPISSDAFQSTSPNGYDFYLFVMERDAESLLYGSYLGGNQADEHVDGGTSRFDKFGVVYQSVCGGCGAVSDFPTTPGAWSATNDAESNCNNLVFKFDFEIIPVADFEVSLLEGCAPLTLTFDNESNDTVNSVWSFPPDAQIISGGVNPVVLFEDPGQYEVFLAITDTICNLTDTAKKIITVYEELNMNVSDDTVICAPTTIDLWANTDGAATSFHWSTNINFTDMLNSGPMDSTITVNPTVSTTYYVTSSNGWPDCDLIDSVQVFFVDGALDVMADTTMCLGDTVNLEAYNLVPSVNLSYDWSPNTGILWDEDSTIYVSPPSSMYYYVTATTDQGCQITDSIYVDVTWLDPATVYAVAEPDSIASGSSTTLTAYPSGMDYLWYPITLVDEPTSQTTTTSNLNETFYFEVEVIGNGCTQRTGVTVYTYEFICGDVYVYVPNAFSPNSDQLNDMLYVRGIEITDLDFKVFDRWGELVFETQDQSVGWDGMYKGKLVDPDVYVYHLTVVCFDGQETFLKGNITVLR